MLPPRHWDGLAGLQVAFRCCIEMAPAASLRVVCPQSPLALPRLAGARALNAYTAASCLDERNSARSTADCGVSSHVGQPAIAARRHYAPRATGSNRTARVEAPLISTLPLWPSCGEHIFLRHRSGS